MTMIVVHPKKEPVFILGQKTPISPAVIVTCDYPMCENCLHFPDTGDFAGVRQEVPKKGWSTELLKHYCRQHNQRVRSNG
jgi:hypothetical protein